MKHTNSHGMDALCALTMYFTRTLQALQVARGAIRDFLDEHKGVRGVVVSDHFTTQRTWMDETTCGVMKRHSVLIEPYTGS